jgi:hypothetical protein
VAGRVQAPEVHSAQALIFHRDAIREVMKEGVQEAFKRPSPNLKNGWRLNFNGSPSVKILKPSGFA